ncbi:MAG TPA: hypothetical protein VFU21_32530 [Kofleriaceae bacterium]|nr:hypothetical protein [Kofleriaceae bacterium]
MRLGAALCAALAAVGLAEADTGMPQPVEGSLLRGALLSGSTDDLERAARNAGSRRLSLALAGAAADRVLALAAADGAPFADDAIWLLVPLTAAAGSPDRPLAVRAARAAARIAGAVDPGDLLAGDVPPDWTRARIHDLRAIAADPGRWTDVRVLALEAAARLHRALESQAGPADAPFDLAAVAVDPDPEIRRAAFELLASPLKPAELALAARAVAGDADPVVALAAGQAACDGLRFGDTARPVLAALGAKGMVRLRALVASKSLSAGARLGAARCLVVDGSRASKKALAALPRRGKRR